jgi:hypothetical protein
MHPTAVTKISPHTLFKMLLVMTILFFALLGFTAFYAMKATPVPLNPCLRCGSGCPCPRMAGTVRCGCPQ